MNIGLLASDSKKELMVNFCIAYQNLLSKHELFATGTTGSKIEHNTDLHVYKFLPGHLGGDRQMVAQIECNQIDAIIFLRDAMLAPSHDMSFDMILQLCDMNNIPVATNLASAEILVIAIDRGDLDWRNLYK